MPVIPIISHSTYRTLALAVLYNCTTLVQYVLYSAGGWLYCPPYQYILYNIMFFIMR